MTIRDDAKASKAGKVARVLGGANKSNSDAVMASEGAKGTPPVTKAIDRGTTKVEGGKAKRRLDRPARAKGGSVLKRGYIERYPDSGQEMAHAEWGDSSRTSGNPNNTHMQALTDKARRQGSFEDKRPQRARGGSVKKGKTNVTVIVAPQGGQLGAASGVGVAGGPMPAGAPPVTAPMPSAAPAAPPPGGMPPLRPPMAPPAAGGMPMRKRGGPVMKAGAGSGLGRLEKAKSA